MKQRLNNQKAIRVPDDMLDELQGIADAEEEGNFARLVRKILREYLDKRKAKS